MTDPSPRQATLVVNDQPEAQVLTEDEIDDLVYFARTGDIEELASSITEISSRTGLSPADVLLKAKDEDGQTPLHMAVANGHLATTTLLISHLSLHPSKRAFLNTQNSFGNTPLHWAAERGHIDIVKFLVSSGADPTIANSKGDIPLDSAQFGMREEVTAYFVGQNERLEKESGKAGLTNAMEDVEIENRVAEEKEEKGGVVNGDEKRV